MGALIELYNGKEPRVKTWDLWKGLGYNHHRYLKEVIASNLDDFKEIDIVIISTTAVVENKKKGRPDESYFLTEDQFLLLVTMVKNTEESKKFKMALVREFKRMRNALASLSSQRTDNDWQQVRKDGNFIIDNIFKEFGFML